MPFRTTLAEHMKQALRAQDKGRLKTLRLIHSELKCADIALRTAGKGREIDAPAILALLQKMVKQRQETIKIYQDRDRQDAADAEAEEIAVIASYLPKMKSETQTKALIKEVIAELGAASLKDMGKVIGHLRARYPGALDMRKTSELVKAALS